MSVLIKDIKMPKSCAFCRFNGSYCYAKGDEDTHSTLSCPLIPVPPHGRLIDEREVQQLLAEMIPVASEIINSKAIIEWVAENIHQCSTIIPASEEDEK